MGNRQLAEHDEEQSGPGDRSPHQHHRPHHQRRTTSLSHGDQCANGFGNRFMWFLVKRSKMLPGGRITGHASDGWIERQLANVLTFAREAGPIERDAAARELWREVYPVLSGRPSRTRGQSDRQSGVPRPSVSV